MPGLNFDPHSIPLPITEIIDPVRHTLLKHSTLIVNAPPGAGKSTLLPLALLNEPWLKDQKIILLEPRRLAAKTIALRMAALLGEDIGEQVGYRIRFETRVGKQTRLEVVTEGILTRMLQNDNALESVGLVIFDEFHERSLHADLALALCRETQSLLRPDLRLLVMSATLNMPQLSKLLQAPALSSEGKMFPVDIHYGNDADPLLLPELVSRTVAEAIQKHPGDCLVFLPGEAEIRKSEALLKEHLKDVSIHPLYGQLSPKEQFAAILPHPMGIRKIVLATSIAETSLTIEGVRIVVDSGFSRTSKFDAGSGLSRLETVRVSKDSADQRAGRAGRLNSGVCYRMWTAATHNRLSDHRVPEIMEADLCSLVLELSMWGTMDILSMCWLNPPPKSSLDQALDTLHQLEALQNNKITPHGKQIHALSCHPRIAHMLIKAGTTEARQLACDIAAIVEERDPLTREAGTDLNKRIEALRRARERNTLNNRFARIEKIAASYRSMFELPANNSAVDPFETGLLLAFAYPERIASARAGNNSQFQLSNGKYARMDHQDDLAHHAWLAIANMDLREGLGKIFLAAPLNPKDLLPLVKEVETIAWDSRKGGLIASKELRIGSISLQSKTITNPNEELVSKAIEKAIQSEGMNLLNFDDDMKQLQCRIMSLRAWNPDETWPDVSTETLLHDNSNWLKLYTGSCRKNDDLRRINLSEALLHSLPWESQQQLNRLAPAKLEVPSGSKIPITYSYTGTTPILAVRLQEVFGMTDTPAVNNGKTKVLLHLLSPGYKPVQITSDLRSFWNNLYHEVRNELKRRYPKHAWPENPLEAKPVAKGKSTK